VARLSQIIAIEKDVRTRAEQVTATVYHQLQKPEPLSGVSKTYEPRDADGERLAPQGNRVQVTVDEGIRDIRTAGARYLDVLGAKEATDQIAVADVIVDGVVFIAAAPVTLLLGLERQLNEELIQVRKLPTLSLEYHWNDDDDQGVYVTDPIMSNRSKKIPKAFEKSPATDKHPAQVDTYFEDVVVGDWTTRYRSGAIPGRDKRAILDRLTKLIEAVKQAREEANTTTAVDFKVGDKVFGYVYGSNGTV
jgi:hypothetical protein